MGYFDVVTPHRAARLGGRAVVVITRKLNAHSALSLRQTSIFLPDTGSSCSLAARPQEPDEGVFLPTRNAVRAK